MGQVSDLEVSLVDSAGNPCLLEKSVKVSISPRPASASSSSDAAGAVVSPARSARRPDAVSKLTISEPMVLMPDFELTMKLQSSTFAASSARGGRRISGVGAQSGAATRNAKDGVALAVRMEGAGMENVEEVGHCTTPRMCFLVGSMGGNHLWCGSMQPPS